MQILYAVMFAGLVGLFCGVLPGLAQKIFVSENDEKKELITSLLPGANCGGCGCAGCAAFAEALIGNNARIDSCCGGLSVENAGKLSDILGTEVLQKEKEVMTVMCCGNSSAAEKAYTYEGIKDNCIAVSLMYNSGDKACEYGCLGYGTCVNVCEYGAISIQNGVAVIDKEKCICCGKCEKVCPRHLIVRVPYTCNVKFACNNSNKGKAVRAVCKSGCLACGLCSKICPEKAITMENNLVHIDYKKCSCCGECVKKCPSGCLVEE